MPKNKPNHITAFIKEVLQPEKSRIDGRNYTIQELVPEAIERFSELSEDEKSYFKSKAKKSRGINITNECFQAPPKKAVDIPTAFAVTNLAEESKKNDFKAAAVHSRIQKFTSKKELLNKEFIFVAVQCFLDFEPHIRPVEVAFVKWSMARGITDCFTELINPGDIPLGLRFTLKDLAEKTHQFTEDKYCCGTSDYRGLWSRITDFISEKGRIEPVYCFLQSCRLVTSCLDWINCQSGRYTMELTVDPLECLFRELLLFADLDIEVNVLKSFLSRYNFDLSETLRCAFHCNPLCEYCAVAFCKKPIYNMLSSLSSVYKFELTESHQQSNEVVLTTSAFPHGWPSKEEMEDFAQLPRSVRKSSGNAEDFDEDDMEDFVVLEEISTEEEAGTSCGTVSNTDDNFPPLTGGRGSQLRYNQLKERVPGGSTAPSFGRGRAFFFRNSQDN